MYHDNSPSKNTPIVFKHIDFKNDLFILKMTILTEYFVKFTKKLLCLFLKLLCTNCTVNHPQYVFMECTGNEYVADFSDNHAIAYGLKIGYNF